jgi:hypothetical protein
MTENGHRNGNGQGHYGAEYVVRPGIVTTPVADRMPPHDLRAERAFLGAIILNSDVLKTIDPPIVPQDFMRESHRILYQALLDVLEQGKPIDEVTLYDELATMRQLEDIDGVALVTEIMRDTPPTTSATDYAGIIRKHAKSRRLAETATEVLKEVYSGRADPSALIETLHKQIASVEAVHNQAPKDDLNRFPPPSKMADAAFYGPAGRAVKILAPYTEACAEAIYANLLILLGNLVGPSAFTYQGTAVHRCNLFGCNSGFTGNGRKGTSLSDAQWILNQSPQSFMKAKFARGLSSGEGLIEGVNKLRAPFVCLETEFAGTLGNMGRQYNNLEAVLMQAWDGRHLAVMTKNNPVDCDCAHVSLVGQINYPILRKLFTEAHVDGGLANRVMWVHTVRSKYIAKRINMNHVAEEIAFTVAELAGGVEFGLKGVDPIVPIMLTAEAEKLWDENGLYVKLNLPRSGIYGAATERRAQIVTRVAMLLAVLDCRQSIDVCHLHAAEAFWDYCDRTAAHVWGSPKEDGNMKRFLEFMEGTKAALTRTEINRKLWAGRCKSEVLDDLLDRAVATGQVVYRPPDSPGSRRHEFIHKKHI